MHEASITQSVIDTVLNALKSEDIQDTVIAVNIMVGVSQGIVPESMKMFFDMQKPDTPLENSELVVSVQRMEAHCPQCDTDHELDIPVLFCPACGTTMTLTKGNEIQVTSIEVEDK
ncbi:hydrogenase maturation nickel metallochaperone HypA [Candidatus Latescibacterota bacterium]